LDNALLSKTGVTPHLLGLWVRIPSSRVPALLVAQCSRLEQHGRSCTRRPGDWCVIDMLHPFATRALEKRNEHLNLTLGRPSDQERLSLLERGTARPWHSKTGMSPVLQTTLTEGFNQMNRLGLSRKKSLH
jgi:hypothetical protein